MLENNPSRENEALSLRLETSGPLYTIHNGKRLLAPTLPFE